ncbi:MAG: HAD family hydrolase [Proteobacteria bacterium]|nr:HAD family hydrolase [Pseudomonadota bacterium]
MSKKKVKIISFDLDGTLVDFEFNELVWHQGIPEKYAEKHNLDFESARGRVRAEYDRVTDGGLSWYDIRHWFNFFGLPGTHDELFERFRHSIRTFPEVKEVMKKLQGMGYEMVLTTNSSREFLTIELQETGLAPYFSRIFSATSDFRMVKKVPEFYRQILGLLGTDEKSVIHVGDHWKFDYLAPREAGIESYFVDRKSEREPSREEGIIQDLSELLKILKDSPKPSVRSPKPKKK